MHDLGETPELRIRPFGAGDLEALRALAGEQVEDGSVFPFEDVEGVLAYWLGPGTAVFVAEIAGRVVGSYTVKPNQADRGSHVANAGYMVTRAARGKGVGERLGRHSLTRARELGYEAMQFNFVVATNGAAVRLWERLGFEVLGRVPGAFRPPGGGRVDVLVMHRFL